MKLMAFLTISLAFSIPAKAMYFGQTLSYPPYTSGVEASSSTTLEFWDVYWLGLNTTYAYVQIAGPASDSGFDMGFDLYDPAVATASTAAVPGTYQVYYWHVALGPYGGYSNWDGPYSFDVVGGGNDQTPIISDISPSTWGAGQSYGPYTSNGAITITGSNFGVNPLVNIDASGLNGYGVSSSTATSIQLWLNVTANAPTQTDVTVTVTSQGASGTGFLGGPGASPTANRMAAIQAAACVPQLYEVRLNGLATNVIINGTSGSIQLNGTCLDGLQGGSTDASGIGIYGLSGSSSQVNGSYQAGQNASTGAFGITLQVAAGNTNAIQAFATKITLREVSFLNDLDIQKDTQGAFVAVSDPVWKSTNQTAQNGAVAYVKGTTMQATIKVGFSPQPPTSIPGVRVEGAITGLGKFIANYLTIPPSSEVTITGLVADTALPQMTKYYAPMSVSWAVSQDGNACGNCATVGTSENKVYVTFATPSTPIALTPLHLAVSNDGATSAAEVFQKTWSQFAGPTNVTTWDGRPLYYYRTGYGFSNNTVVANRSAIDPAELITSASGSGECGSFRELLMWALAINGVDSTPVSVRATDGTFMIVREWSFGGQSFPFALAYKWALTLNPAALAVSDFMVPAQPSNQYGGLTSLTGLAGQNSTPPSEKLFASHFIIKVDPSLAGGMGPYFDPSYGVWYSGAADFEAKAISGYATHVTGDDLNEYRARLVGGGMNIVLSQ